MALVWNAALAVESVGSRATDRIVHAECPSFVQLYIPVLSKSLSTEVPYTDRFWLCNATKTWQPVQVTTSTTKNNAHKDRLQIKSDRQKIRFVQINAFQKWDDNSKAKGLRHIAVTQHSFKEPCKYE